MKQHEASGDVPRRFKDAELGACNSSPVYIKILLDEMRLGSAVRLAQGWQAMVGLPLGLPGERERQDTCQARLLQLQCSVRRARWCPVVPGQLGIVFGSLMYR